MNFWILSKIWVLIGFELWLSTFTPSERVALFAAFLVLLGVIGEEIAELKPLEEEKRAGIKQNIKRWAIGVLILGLAGDVIGIVMSQAEMQALTREAGNAATSATGAVRDARVAHDLAKEASDTAGTAKKVAGEAQTKADTVGQHANRLDTGLSAADKQLELVDAKRKQLDENLTNLAICNAPRVISVVLSTDDKGVHKTNSDPLKPYARGFIIEYVQDAETRRAAFSIANVLIQAGWKMIRATPEDDVRDGVEVQPYQAPLPLSSAGPTSDQEEAARQAMDATEALVAFLKSFNWMAHWDIPIDDNTHRFLADEKVMPRGSLRIRVGLYPAVSYVAPSAMKEFSESLKRQEKAMEKIWEKQEDEIAKRIGEQVKLGMLTPELAAELKSRQAEREAEHKRMLEENSSPCQTLSGLPTSMP